MKNEDKKYWLWFSKLKSVNCIQKNLLLKLYCMPQEIWKLEEEELNKIKGLSKESINEILNNKNRENLEEYVNYINKENIKIITIYDEIYPEKLKNIYDNPVVLYAKGNLKLLNEEGVSIVGSRNCSSYGKQISELLAYNLAKNNKCIISGLAKGIDTCAHIGTLKAKGKTIAVIGNGIDNIYPFENKKLSELILKNNGLIVTEYIIGSRPDKLNFPQRNRIISGLSDGVVVVEAKRKSGALITADFALEQGKDVFAIPGNINNVNSEGTNELIKQGAHIVTNYKDILDICYGLTY